MPHHATPCHTMPNLMHHHATPCHTMHIAPTYSQHALPPHIPSTAFPHPSSLNPKPQALNFKHSPHRHPTSFLPLQSSHFNPATPSQPHFIPPTPTPYTPHTLHPVTVHTHTHARKHTHLYMYMYVYLYVCVDAYNILHTHTNTHTHTHAHTRTNHKYRYEASTSFAPTRPPKARQPLGALGV
jgi:hypothetical protein